MEHCVYVVADGPNAKIGITNNLSSRMQSYGTHNPTAALHGYHVVPSQAVARAVEQQIKTELAGARVGTGREWFRVSPDVMLGMVASAVGVEKSSTRLASHIPITSKALRLISEYQDMDRQHRKDFGGWFGVLGATMPEKVEKRYWPSVRALNDKYTDLLVHLGDAFGLGQPARMLDRGRYFRPWDHMDRGCPQSLSFPGTDHIEEFYIGAFCSGVVLFPYESSYRGDATPEVVARYSRRTGWSCYEQPGWGTVYAKGGPSVVVTCVVWTPPVHPAVTGQKYATSFLSWLLSRYGALLPTAEDSTTLRYFVEDTTYLASMCNLDGRAPEQFFSGNGMHYSSWGPEFQVCAEWLFRLWRAETSPSLLDL